MSHTTTIKSVAIKSVTALQATVQELKNNGLDCELLTNTKPRMYFSSQYGECEYVLKLNKCPYDVGFKLELDGSYSIVYDDWNEHVKKQIGTPRACRVPQTQEEKQLAHIGTFAQLYAKNVALEEAYAAGYSNVNVSYSNETGDYVLEIYE